MAFDIDVVLVTPPGLDPHIYPWGVQSLADTLASRDAGARVTRWSLHEAAWVRALADRYGDALLALVRALRPEASNVFFGHTVSPTLLLGAAACAGAGFVDVAARARLLGRLRSARALRRRVGGRLDALQRDYRAELDGWIDAHCAAAPGARRLWGLSVYDYTLLDGLHVSQRIRALDPEAAIVLGGDYFDYQAAGAVTAAVAAVDAAVVGYGEQTLVQLVAALRRTGTIAGTRAPGLVMRGAATETDGPACDDGADRLVTLGRTALVNVPASYRAPGEPPPVRYAQARPDGSVRVLTQRGCSWGKCTFCSQIDRRMYFQIGTEHIVAQLDEALAHGADGIRRVVLDADENDLGVVLPVLERLNDTDDRFVAEFWLMVRKFGAELPRFLAWRNRRVLAKVILNVESLNQRTLRRMKKGVSTLEAVQAIKAVQDVGHVVQSNYFVNYPRESVDDVREEAALLARVVHLLMPPRVLLSGFSYMANGRDDIRFDRERYGVRAGRLREDVWLRALFGVDVPFSVWSYRYDKARPGADAAAWVAYSYHRVAMAERGHVLDRAVHRCAGRARARRGRAARGAGGLAGRARGEPVGHARRRVRRARRRVPLPGGRDPGAGRRARRRGRARVGVRAVRAARARGGARRAGVDVRAHRRRAGQGLRAAGPRRALEPAAHRRRDPGAALPVLAAQARGCGSAVRAGAARAAGARGRRGRAGLVAAVGRPRPGLLAHGGSPRGGTDRAHRPRRGAAFDWARARARTRSGRTARGLAHHRSS